MVNSYQANVTIETGLKDDPGSSAVDNSLADIIEFNSEQSLHWAKLLR
jgi:hypothetical protein